MKPEELSIMGLLLILFGIGWIAYGWSLPIPAYSTCSNGNAIAGIPQCGAPGPAAQSFFGLGTLALLIGGLMFFMRWYGFREPALTNVPSPVKPTELPGGPTPASFLKNCPNCGRDLPIAAEKCYTCGALV